MVLCSGGGGEHISGVEGKGGGAGRPGQMPLGFQAQFCTPGTPGTTAELPGLELREECVGQ